MRVENWAYTHFSSLWSTPFAAPAVSRAPAPNHRRAATRATRHTTNGVVRCRERGAASPKAPFLGGGHGRIAGVVRVLPFTSARGHSLTRPSVPFVNLVWCGRAVVCARQPATRSRTRVQMHLGNARPRHSQRLPRSLRRRVGGVCTPCTPRTRPALPKVISVDD